MLTMAEEGLLIQCKSNKLFNAFFSKQFISTEVLKYQDATDDSTYSLMSLLRMDASILKSSFKAYATQFAIQAIDGLIIGHPKISGTFVYSIISKLASKGELNFPSIQDSVNNYPALVPTNVIVELEKIGVISITLYFQSSTECPSKKLEWINLLFASALAPWQNCKPQEHNLFEYLLTTIIHVGFGELPADLQKTINGHTVKFAVSLLSDLTTKIWEFLWEFSEKEVRAFEFSNQGLHFQLSSLKNCYLEQLAFLISYKPEIKPVTAIKLQHEWTFFRSPKNVVNLIVQLLIPLEVGTVLDKIDEILNRYDINWKSLLLIVSAIQVCYPTGSKYLKALINSFMQRALDNLQMDLLLASFLLARQINAENTSSPHYGAWFSSITSSLTTSKQFAFLLKFLTNIVRHEPHWVLLAHKNNPPVIPMVDNCRNLWTDYSALIRTRIEDFKVNQSSNQVVEEDSNLVKEVDTAIAAFEKSDRRNRRIPSSVIEAAIFRKPYFVNKFLSVLLKPRRVPDPSDIREEFIEELRKSGKLPLVQYEAYCTACRKLGQNIPEIEQMDWQEPEGKPSYKTLMNQIVFCNETRQQSVLFEHLDSLLGTVLPPLESSAPVIIFNPENNEMKTKNAVAWKIAECWIDSVQSSYSIEKQLEWLNRYFLLFSRYPSFIESLYYLVWDFTHNCSGSDDLLRCYGVVIFLLSHNSHILLPVRYQAFDGAFSILLMDEDQLAMNREDSIPFHLRLLYYTVTEAKRQNELSSVRLPSLLYLWLSRRIFHSNMMLQYKQYLALSEDVEFRKETRLPLRNWLKLEMTVEADMDVLSCSERPGYLHSVLQDYQNIHMTELYPIILDSIIERHNSTGRANYSKDLLLLLQSLLCEDQPTSTSDSSAWLIQYWLQLRLKKGNNVDQILWSVVCCLPPYLLSRNYYSQPAQQPTLKTLVNLIENDWRNTLTSESAWFPKSIASHLLRALEGTSSQDIPCLQFSAQIHAIHDARVASGPWKTLDKALNTFHPLLCDPQNAETIRWSGLTEVDLLACQLMALTAVVWCAKGITAELPLFIKELGPNISRNPNLMKAWKITFWTGDDCTMPWKKIIPTYMLNLLPFVILRSLISWSDVLLLTASDYLDALVTAHNQWNQTTRSFIDLASEHDNQSQADYPAGKILDLYTLGRLGSDVKHILKRAPLHTLKTFKQSSCFRSMETDYQEIVREMLATFKLLRMGGASSIDTVFHLKKFPDLYNWLCVE